MLRKVSGRDGKDWDKLLPYLLFAYREVPQASTGFSPFELLYGHRVRGPLSVLSESWQSSERGDENVVSHVLSMSYQQPEEIPDPTEDNRKAREREFKPGDMVLLLLPTSTSKLLAQWQGPYRVLKKVGSIDYQIEMPHRRKKRQIFHVNLLKK